MLRLIMLTKDIGRFLPFLPFRTSILKPNLCKKPALADLRTRDCLPEHEIPSGWCAQRVLRAWRCRDSAFCWMIFPIHSVAQEWTAFDAVSASLCLVVTMRREVIYPMMTRGECRREKVMTLKFSLSSAEKTDCFHQSMTMAGTLDELIKNAKCFSRMPMLRLLLHPNETWFPYLVALVFPQIDRWYNHCLYQTYSNSINNTVLFSNSIN